MLYKDICKILGNYLYGLSLVMIIPLLLAGYYEFITPEKHLQPHSTLAFLLSILICIMLASICAYVGKGGSGRLYRKEGLAAVIAVWLLTPALAAMPFVFSGTLTSPIQAYFEAASAITTSGASVMEPKKYDPITGQEIPNQVTICGIIPTEYVFYGTITPVRDPLTHKEIYSGVEAVSKALLFWRSFMQWLGGMGIIVLFVAVLPALGVGGKMLFQAEATGPIKETLTPRIKEAAAQLWKIYFGLTFLEVILLLFTNNSMSLFDAICVSLGTISTGGLSVKNASIAAYNNASTEWIVMIFMLLGSINFSLYYYLIRGKFYRLNTPEFWIYLAIIFVGCCFVAFKLVGTPIVPLYGTSKGVYNYSEAIRHGFFQAISAQTTTGYATANYDLWPYAIQAFMLIAMLVGGMAGSTSGGVKVIRYYMLFRICRHKVESLFRPEAIRKIRIGGKEIDQPTIITVLSFFVIVVAFLSFGIFLLIIDGVDPETSLSVMTCVTTNSGMGFRMSAPLWSYAFLSTFGTIVSALWMMLGRLEFFAFLVLLIPSFWKQQ